MDKVDRARDLFELTAKVPFVGAGDGIGVVVNKETGERTYLKVSDSTLAEALEFGNYRLVIVFFEEEALKSWPAASSSSAAGVEAGAKDKDVGTGRGNLRLKEKEKYVLYQLSDTGVSATITVNVIKLLGARPGLSSLESSSRRFCEIFLDEPQHCLGQRLTGIVVVGSTQLEPTLAWDRAIGTDTAQWSAFTYADERASRNELVVEQTMPSLRGSTHSASCNWV